MYQHPSIHTAGTFEAQPVESPKFLTPFQIQVDKGQWGVPARGWTKPLLDAWRDF